MKTIILIAFFSFITGLKGQHRNFFREVPPGKILFFQSFKDISRITDRDPVSRYTLTPKSDLSFMAFFDQPLTAYISQLDRDVKRDSLFRTGNYRFTILVDHREIYSSNLLPGAPQQKVQDTAVVLIRPLINTISGQGSWSESFWNRFMSNGGEKTLTDGLHHLRLEIRPYLRIRGQVKTGPLMAAGELDVLAALHPVIDIRKITVNSPQPYDGFPVSSKKFDTAKIKELKGLIDAGIYKQINSIVVINNGKLQIEEYFNGEGRNTLHDPRSVGKSFASTLTGMAIGKKLIKDEDQKLSTFYRFNDVQHPEGKNEATVKELLTMSSGFEGNDDDPASPGNEEKMYPTDDWNGFVLNLPYDPTLKNRWHYFTAGTILLGDLLDRSVPGGLERFADENLFGPLNITDYRWEYTPRHIPNTAGGIRMKALDFAKYGQLYKNNGIWNGRRVLPESWVRKTMTRQVQIPDRKDEYYSYLFWNKSFKAGGRIWEAFYCAGNGGNYILIFKDLPLVIVITASAYGQSYAHSQVTGMLEQFILPAVL